MLQATLECATQATHASRGLVARPCRTCTHFDPYHIRRREKQKSPMRILSVGEEGYRNFLHGQSGRTRAYWPTSRSAQGALKFWRNQITGGVRERSRDTLHALKKKTKTKGKQIKAKLYQERYDNKHCQSTSEASDESEITRIRGTPLPPGVIFLGDTPWS